MTIALDPGKFRRVLLRPASGIRLEQGVVAGGERRLGRAYPAGPASTNSHWQSLAGAGRRAALVRRCTHGTRPVHGAAQPTFRFRQQRAIRKDRAPGVRGDPRRHRVGR